MTPDRDHFDQPLPEDLRAVGEALDRLARADAETTRAGFDRRLADATRPVLVGAARHARPRHRHAVIGRIRPAHYAGVAAAITIVASVAILWSSAGSKPVSPATTNEVAAYASDVDLLLSLTSYDSGFNDQLNTLVADTIALEAEFDSGPETWSVLDDGGSL